MRKADRIYVALIVLGVLGIFGVWWFGAAMEARAYNRATGADVTTWDAMWVELRVQASPGGAR